MIFVWSWWGVTGDTVLNVMRGIRDSQDKNAESTERKNAVSAATKAADISEQMTLGKATVEKLEAIEDNGERVEAVGNINKPRTTATLVMNVNNVRVHAAKNNLRLYCIVALNASGVLNNGVMV